jgi:NADPH-dependent 7-cyano-7-deazaguanine reductase QueF-like protein
MVMLGADFFHVGYFNVTGKTGWPNGKGPNDPRGYIYQAAMPAYAQAIASQAWEFLDKGKLLEDPLSKEQQMPFAFAASASNHLVLVRKLDKKYLIYGSVQPNSNYKGNTVLETTTSIILEGKKISFNIRRQGSMYVLDLAGAQPVFYQLDGWHQYEHPYYWSGNFLVEAEHTHNKVQVITESKDFDFTHFTSFIRVNNSNTVDYNVPHRQGENVWNSLIIRCRKKNGDPFIFIEYGEFSKKAKISGESWNEIKLDLKELSQTKIESWKITVNGGAVDIDFLEWRVK